MIAPVQQSLARAGTRYLRLLEYFIPPAMQADREAANQARMFLISHSMGPILGNAVPLAVLLFNPTFRWDAVVLAFAITLFWAFPFLLRAGLPYKLLVLTSVINLNFCILWSCYFYGGVSSPTLPWLLIIPILSLFYIGGEKQLQPHLLAISAGSFALFLAVYRLLPPPAIDMPDYAVHGLGIVSTTAALCYVATMAVYYARIFDAGIALEAEVRRRRETTDQLRKAVADADRAGMAKAEFLTRMSHELRTPLNAVIGYSQILREEVDMEADATMREDIERIHSAGQYLLRLVNLILDLSKLEAGRIRFDVKKHLPARLVATAVSARRALVEAGGNGITIDVPADLPEIEVDATRVGQVLDVLIENAAQHTVQGTIAIAARRSPTAPDMLQFFVSDTGEGIEPAVLSTLFETLTAQREAADGRYGGTGLSLTVMHRLCRAMGGSIEVDSAPGLGSRFTVTIPFRRPGDAETDTTPVTQLRAA